MSVTIRRTEDSQYQLEASDGTVIKHYAQASMTHPDDWLSDARNAGETVHGPYDWEYVDDRPE